MQTVASNRNVLDDCFYAVHTHQLEFTNTSLPTLVCRVKGALRFVRARAHGRANDAKIVRSMDAQCNTKELP